MSLPEKLREVLRVIIAAGRCREHHDMLAEAAFALFPIVFVVFVVNKLSGDGSTIGLMRGVAAFGGILASLVVARLSTQQPWKLMAVGFVGLGLVDFAFANLVQTTTFLL